jgi:uncharacterized membrane protein/thiol-disulfide isomerase/thioredoxin
LIFRRLVPSLVLLAALAAPPARAEAPVVNAVLFYSPTCPHCHKVIAEQLPPIQARFGDRLRILYVDVSGPPGGGYFAAAMAEQRIPRERQGVPTMVVGGQLLIGEDEIPAALPGLVDRLLLAGGAPPPAFLGFAAVPPPAAAPPPAPAFPRFPRDPTSVAVLAVLLAALLLQLGHAVFTWRRRPAPRGGVRRWLTPALLLGSLGVALYLARAELSGSHVLCLSDCDAVHASAWAWLFGVVPVGAFGAAGVLGLLVAWGLSFHRRARVAAWAGAAFLVMALFGVAFSVYLTFLELFVIGAMCEWCVGNAVLMAIVAALALAPGKRALDAALA